MKILVTGATGYVGGRLIPRLLERGHRVRVLVRDPRRIQGRPWAEQVEIAVGDILQPQAVQRALDDIDAAYYLIHSMGGGRDFRAQDRWRPPSSAARPGTWVTSSTWAACFRRPSTSPSIY